MKRETEVFSAGDVGGKRDRERERENEASGCVLCCCARYLTAIVLIILRSCITLEFLVGLEWDTHGKLIFLVAVLSVVCVFDYLTTIEEIAWMNERMK